MVTSINLTYYLIMLYLRFESLVHSVLIVFDVDAYNLGLPVKNYI